MNRASEMELTELPGVGPVLAARILERRRLHGRISSLAALDSVPGVGPALLEKLRERVRFEDFASGCCRMRQADQRKD